MSETIPTTLVAAADAMRRGQLSPVELCEALLRRAEGREEALHCFASLDGDLALRAAERAEAELLRGNPRGPLHGIPVALKDIIATADLPTHVGSVVLANWNPGVDSAVARRLRGAGAILLAKTNTTEAAFMDHHPERATPRNPWHPDAWTGVSSSGSGAATAAGLCFGALGTDTGGSIRFPAYCQGLVGLKGTWGRVSRDGVFPLAPSLDHVGPMARCVADTALLFEALAGPDAADPTSLAAPDYIPPDLGSGVRGLRVAFDERVCTEGLAAPVAGALREVAEVLADAGASVEPIALPSSREAVDAFPTLVTTEAGLSHRETPESEWPRYSPALRAALEAARDLSAIEYAAAHQARLRYRGALSALFERVDLYIAPAWARTTPTLAEYAASHDSELAGLIEYTAPQNLAGVPTLSLPSGLDERGVPYGFQLVAAPWREDALLRAGATYEASREPLPFPLDAD